MVRSAQPSDRTPQTHGPFQDDGDECTPEGWVAKLVLGARQGSGTEGPSLLGAVADVADDRGGWRGVEGARPGKANDRSEHKTMVFQTFNRPCCHVLFSRVGHVDLADLVLQQPRARHQLCQLL